MIILYHHPLHKHSKAIILFLHDGRINEYISTNQLYANYEEITKAFNVTHVFNCMHSTCLHIYGHNPGGNSLLTSYTDFSCEYAILSSL